VTNLLNAKQIVNVYPTTGSAQDDGWLSSPAASQFKAIPNYEAFYRAINNENRYAVMGTSGRGAGTGADLYGIPRQIRVGLRAEI
jgi:hypothetical protein